jgi:DNA mismatch endonuclease, patch repair protein
VVGSIRPVASTENARRTMQANGRVSNTEIRFRRALRQAGFAGYRISMRLPGSPDVIFTRGRVAVFVHGCFWHGCPTCDLPKPKAHSQFWSAKFAENRRRDARAESALVADGWLPMVVWEHEIRNDLGGAIAKTMEVVRSRRAAT